MVREYFDRISGALKVLTPLLESREDSQEFFVVGVIVKFSRGKGTRVEGNRVYFTILGVRRENSTKGIVRGISFNKKLSIRSPMDQDQSRGKSQLESFKSIAAIAVKVPRH
jgi:hypothetical protein